MEGEPHYNEKGNHDNQLPSITTQGFQARAKGGGSPRNEGHGGVALKPPGHEESTEVS